MTKEILHWQAWTNKSFPSWTCLFCCWFISCTSERLVGHGEWYFSW